MICELLVGVGGQGTLTAARILGEAAHAAGLPVRLGQLHGMSQRGGSVRGTVLLGPGQGAFLPGRGADVVIALEPLELMRCRDSLHAGSRVVVSSGRIAPSSLAQSGRDYPDIEGFFEELRPQIAELVVVDGPALAGGSRGLNVALLGVLADRGWLPFGAEAIVGALEAFGAHRESNRRVFEAGRKTTQR